MASTGKRACAHTPKSPWRKGRTVKGVHQSIAGNGGAGAAGSRGEGMVDANPVADHEVLDGLIGCEIDGMGRT